MADELNSSDEKMSCNTVHDQFNRTASEDLPAVVNKESMLNSKKDGQSRQLKYYYRSTEGTKKRNTPVSLQSKPSKQLRFYYRKKQRQKELNNIASYDPRNGQELSDSVQSVKDDDPEVNNLNIATNSNNQCETNKSLCDRIRKW